MQTYLFILGIAGAFLTAERLFPGRELPLSRGWYLRAWLLNTAQLGIVVLLATGVAIFLGSGQMLATQAALSAALVATLQPPTDGVTFARFVDALRGLGVAVKVVVVRQGPTTVDPAGVPTDAGPVKVLTPAQARAGGERL